MLNVKSTHASEFLRFALEAGVLVHVSLNLDRWRCYEHDVRHELRCFDRFRSL